MNGVVLLRSMTTPNKRRFHMKSFWKWSNWLQHEHSIEVSHHTVQCKLKALGLSWSKVKPQKRSLGSFRLKAIRDCLIDFNHYVCAMETTMLWTAGAASILNKQ